MTSPANAAVVSHAGPAAPAVLALQRSLVWLVGATCAIVLVEPSPYEVATLLATMVFFATGMRLHPGMISLVALLVLVNLGFSIGAIPVLDDPVIVNWIVTSWYMGFTVVFFAMLMLEDTEVRLKMLRSGLIAGAVIASVAGIAGYLHLVPGGYDLLTLYGRARGTFKDPNVLGAFLILPTLFLLQSVLTDAAGKALRSGLWLGVVGLGLLLAFSRAAWGGTIITATCLLALMVLTATTNRERSRILITAGVALLAGVVLIVVLLSIDSVADMFKQRASFGQSYDSGRFGRFGRHILGADMALDLPLGIGPLQFLNFFPENTHNSFLNAFMSGGWLSGVCYPALVLTPVLFGLPYLFVRAPWQRTYLAVFSAYVCTVGESFIIDTDHWRHFFMMLGVIWGLFIASQPYRSGTATSPPR